MDGDDVMRSVSALVGSGVVSLVAATGIASPVHADDTTGLQLNGRYLVTSNGQWSKTNEVFHDEQVVRQVWTTSSSCESPTSCTGHLTSSLGWEADMVYTEDRWVVLYVRRWLAAPMVIQPSACRAIQAKFLSVPPAPTRTGMCD